MASSNVRLFTFLYIEKLVMSCSGMTEKMSCVWTARGFDDLCASFRSRFVWYANRFTVSYQEMKEVVVGAKPWNLFAFFVCVWIFDVNCCIELWGISKNTFCLCLMNEAHYIDVFVVKAEWLKLDRLIIKTLHTLCINVIIQQIVIPYCNWQTYGGLISLLTYYWCNWLVTFCLIVYYFYTHGFSFFNMNWWTNQSSAKERVTVSFLY